MSISSVEKFSVIFDLCEAGRQMYRLRMRDEHPDASDSDVDALVDAWLRDRSIRAGERVRQIADH